MQKFAREQGIIRVVKLDDPGKLVAHQLSVTLPQSERYLRDMQDPKKRVRAALGRGMNFEGTHPKARKEGSRLIKPVPHAEFHVAAVNDHDFALKEGRRNIAVKEFDGRLLLWSGYHRSHMSIYRNRPEEMVLPLFAVLESDTVDGFFSANSPAPFKRDMVRGSCPPLLADFFDESLCIELPVWKCEVEIFVDLKTNQWGRNWLHAT
jgi:hypothetical protein